MRFLLAFSLLIVSYLSAQNDKSTLIDFDRAQLWNDITISQVNSNQTSQFDIPEFIALDEDTEFNEFLINCTFLEIDTEFIVELFTPFFKNAHYFSNLITFGTDSSPPVSFS